MKHLEALKFLDNQTKFWKGTVKTMLVRLHHDIAEKDAAKALRSVEDEGAHLAVLIKDGTPELFAVPADGVLFHTHTLVSLKAIMLLLAVYFVCDIAYPKPYSMVLGLLQQRVLGQRFQGFKEKSGYKKSQGYGHIMSTLDTSD